MYNEVISSSLNVSDGSMRKWNVGKDMRMSWKERGNDVGSLVSAGGCVRDKEKQDIIICISRNGFRGKYQRAEQTQVSVNNKEMYHLTWLEIQRLGSAASRSSTWVDS